MICGECGERPATVRLTEMRDGELLTVSLCDECARRRRVGAGLSSLAGPLVNILMGLLEESLAPGGEEPRDIPDCPQCGLSYMEFRRSGRLGCAACYESFGEELKPLLRRVHGSTSHVGRLRSGEQATVSAAQELSRLRAALDRAVRREDYERAAELRDEIRARLVEKEAGTAGDARVSDREDGRSARSRRKAGDVDD